MHAIRSSVIKHHNELIPESIENLIANLHKHGFETDPTTTFPSLSIGLRWQIGDSDMSGKT